MLDEKELKILQALKQDSRASIRDIAKKTNLRPSTVHQKIKKLKQNNTIEKFTVKLNNKAADENFIVFVLIKAKGEIENTTFRNPHVKEVFGITGEYDLLLKMKFKDISQFNKFILNLRKNKTIETTLTMVATINIKEEI